jgi:hypothetical protein
MRRFIPYASTALMLLAAGCGGFTTLGDGVGTGGTANASGMGVGDNGGDTTTGGTTSTGGSGDQGGTTSTGGSGNQGGTTSTGGSGNQGGTGATGGTGTAGSGGTYNPCASAACGSTCTLCDPNDPTCVDDQLVRYCGGDGCSLNFPSCITAECTTAKECATPASCQLCADGSAACPTSDCVNGKCVTTFPTCPTPECMSDGECPISKAPCQLCPDGSTACPWARCTDGKCTSGIDTCDDSDPCKGKSCGDLCSTCPAGATCNGLALFCDENLNCQVNQPLCTAPQCKQDADCATEVCGQCAGSNDCASQVCVDGRCQFSCPTPQDPCGGCPSAELCVEQLGGPATTSSADYHCAKAPPCPVAAGASQCLCVQGEGSCKQATDSGGTYCQCDNGIR